MTGQAAFRDPSPRGKPRRGPSRRGPEKQAGFTFNELLVVTGVVIAILAGAIGFFRGNYDQARESLGADHLAAGLRSIRALPSGSAWEVSANRLLADALGAPRHTASTAADTQADALAGGLHAGLGTTLDRSLMKDSNGANVSFPSPPGCPVGAIQITIYPDGLPAGSLLHEVPADWLSAVLEPAVPDIVLATSEEAVFGCLPRL